MNLTLPTWRQGNFPNPFTPTVLLLITVFLSVLYLKGCSEVTPQTSSNPVVATVSKPLVNLEKVEVALETPQKVFKVYPQSTKKKLQLPKEVINSASIHLTDSSVIKAQESAVQVNQVMDVTTGETTTYVSNLPPPWLAPENRGSASLDYGFKRNATTPVARLNVREDLLQVKAIHLGVSGSVYSDGDYFVGIGGEYKW